MNRLRHWIWILACGLGLLTAGAAPLAEAPPPPSLAALQAFSVILGRPGDTRMALNLLSANNRRVTVAYAPEGKALHAQDPVTLTANAPQEIELTSLKPDSRYHYRISDTDSGKLLASATFHTQRRPGSAFRFELQGDSHPERRKQFDADLYWQTLSHAAEDQPDFYIAMGDDFSVDTLQDVNRETVTERYRYQRPFLARVGQSAPLFLVNGNHEQASAFNHDGTANNVAVWAQTARNRYYSLPAPGGIYSGDTAEVAHIGLLRDYYAWQWGDALLIVLDPYWHSPVQVDNPLSGKGNKRRDFWNMTIGNEQYQWLSQTLAQSKARFKLVFIHHVLGTGRGGVKQAALYEWGGFSRNGRDEFAQYRPDWPLPIHQLLVRHGVNIVFQGHDHLFAHEERDGVVYQTVPEPADPNYAQYFAEDYAGAQFFPNSGRVRVSVEAAQLKVEYLRSYLPEDRTPEQADNQVQYQYTLHAK